MKVPLEWLKEFVAIRMSPKELAERLTMAGLEVVAIAGEGNRATFELEITPNRPDCLSIIGVAREVAAVTGERLKEGGRWKVEGGKNKNVSPLSTFHSPLSKRMVAIHDPRACPRYTARVIEKVTIANSPDWLVKRLEAVGLRSINNVVDITNYVLFEYGQPLHAFDLDKLRGDSIHIRFAREGEDIVTIDGISRKLSRQDLVIADEERPIALAGVMGGKETEVTIQTKNILLESACFDPVTIRRTARRLGLMSESSYRFERGVALENVFLGSNRATELFVALAKAQQVGPIVDQGKKKTPKRMIPLSLDRVGQLLGKPFSPREIRTCLGRIGCTSLSTLHFPLSVSVPWFRRDLKEEQDLLEEIARLHGYDRIPATVPLVRESLSLETSELILFQDQLRQWLTGLGFNEARCYSLVSQELLEIFGEASRSNLIKIQNPQSREQALMRPNLIAGLLESVQRNFSHQQKGSALFELSNVYTLSEKGRPQEILKLGLVLAGTPQRHWRKDRNEFDWFELKGILESLFSTLRISSVHWSRGKTGWGFDGTMAEIQRDGKNLGVLGQVSSSILSSLDIEKKVFIAELDVATLLEESKKQIRFHPLPKFPPVRRDVALEVEESISTQGVINLIRQTAGTLLADVELFDFYQGPQLTPGHKSLAFSLEYRAMNRTLTDEEINRLHRQVGQILQEQLQAKIR